MKRAMPIGLFLLLAAFAAAEAQAQFVVIVNAKNPIAAASPSMVSGMFLKRIGQWPNGVKSNPVDLIESSGIRDAFSREILGRRVPEIEQFWQTAIFSGRNIPPPKKAAEAEVVSYVALHSGAIGYVSAATPLTPEVKVLQVRE